MPDFNATCRCGQLRVNCTGDPVRVSVCHCLECQKRSGSVFATQARWPAGQVEMTGKFNEWSQVGDTGSRAVFRFCAECGSTVAYVNEGSPDTIAVPVVPLPIPAFRPHDFRATKRGSTLGLPCSEVTSSTLNSAFGQLDHRVFSNDTMAYRRAYRPCP